MPRTITKANIVIVFKLIPNKNMIAKVAKIAIGNEKEAEIASLKVKI